MVKDVKDITSLPSAWVGQQLWNVGLGGLLDVSQPLLEHYVMIVSNVFYVGLMLAGFRSLPANFMLFVGILSFAFGPALITMVIGLASYLVMYAANHPQLVVFCAWLVVLLQHSFVQNLGVRLGLDKDQDGDVDWLDAIKALHEATKGSCIGRWLQLDKVHKTLHIKMRLGRRTTLGTKIEKIERFLDEHHAMNRIMSEEVANEGKKKGKQGCLWLV